MASQNRIVELAAIISEQTTVVNDYFVSQSLPTPTLDHTAPGQLPIPPDAPEIEKARRTVIEATDELQALMKGPRELLFVPWTEHVSLHAIVRFNMAKSFPVGQQATFEDITRKSSLSKKTTRRLLRHGMAARLFCEPKPGLVAHTGLTKALAEDEMIDMQVLNTLDNLLPPATKVVDALQKWPDAEEPNQTAFALANNTNKSMWEVFKEEPDRGQVFGRAMGAVNQMKGYEPRHFHEGFPWEDLGQATVVDLGGSHGDVMIPLAKRFPNLRCVVQDLPEVISERPVSLSTEVADRVTFQAHDFFTPQTVSASVYYTRSILHNWSDKYCIEILRNLIPALKPGARVLAHEIVVPEPGTMSKTIEKRIRHLDIGMLQLLNARQREAKEFEDLFQEADSRFKVVQIHKPEGGTQAIVEARWM